MNNRVGHNTLFLSCTTRTLPLDLSTTAPGQNNRKRSVTSHMEGSLGHEMGWKTAARGGKHLRLPLGSAPLTYGLCEQDFFFNLGCHNRVGSGRGGKLSIWLWQASWNGSHTCVRRAGSSSRPDLDLNVETEVNSGRRAKWRLAGGGPAAANRGYHYG